MNYSSLLSRQSVLILGTGAGRFSVSAEDRHMAASEEKSILSIHSSSVHSSKYTQNTLIKTVKHSYTIMPYTL